MPDDSIQYYRSLQAGVDLKDELTDTKRKLAACIESADNDLRNERQERADQARALQAVIDTLATAAVTGSAESMAEQVVRKLTLATEALVDIISHDPFKRAISSKIAREYFEKLKET